MGQVDEKMVELLSAAQCPSCDGSGAIPYPVQRCCQHATETGECCNNPYVDYDIEQCRWCAERAEVLAAYRGETHD